MSGPPVRITEIFHSIQGESSRAGLPCVFVRLTGCSLRCTYCDTQYSYFGGEEMSVGDVVTRVSRYETPLVEVTGGEPLEQDAVYPLMERLMAAGHTVMLETGGHVSVANVPAPVIKVIDVKTPDSGEPETFLLENLELAAPHDEFKFVISTRNDYEWSRDFFRRHLAHSGQVVLFSPAHGTLPNLDLAKWILEDRLGVRMQLQLHKHIWHPNTTGV